MLYSNTDINIKYWRPFSELHENVPKITSTDNCMFVSIPIVHTSNDNDVDDVNEFISPNIAPGMICMKSYSFAIEDSSLIDESESVYTITNTFTSPYVNEANNWVINDTVTDVKASENFSGSLFIVEYNNSNHESQNFKESIRFTNENENQNDIVRTSVLFDKDLWEKDSIIIESATTTGETITVPTVKPKYRITENKVLTLNEISQLKNTIIFNITYNSRDNRYYTTFWSYTANDQESWEFKVFRLDSEHAFDLYKMINIKSIVEQVRDNVTDASVDTSLFKQLVFTEPELTDEFKNKLDKQLDSETSVTKVPVIKTNPVHESQSRKFLQNEPSTNKYDYLYSLGVSFLDKSDVVSTTKEKVSSITHSNQSVLFI